MQHTALFEEQVPLTPKDLRNEITSIDAILEEKLKGRLEGRCSRHGFVMPSSLKILSRSMGILEKGRFTGNLLFHVQAEGNVLNPPDGIVIEGEVIRKNKMGLYVNYQDAVRIIIPRDLHIGNDEYEAVEIGDTIQVEVKKSRFQVNDEYILSVGLFKGLGKGFVRAAPAAAAAAAVDETLDDEDAEGKEAESKEADAAEVETEESKEEDVDGDAAEEEVEDDAAAEGKEDDAEA